MELEKTKKRLKDAGFGEEILTVKQQNFCTIDEIAAEAGGFDFILADLGVSSMQIDNPQRGFSFKADGPLDLRLNQKAGISAAERLRTISREELEGMLDENSDEPYCRELARAITDEIRKGNPIDTTVKLRDVIARTLDFLPALVVRIIMVWSKKTSWSVQLSRSRPASSICRNKCRTFICAFSISSKIRTHLGCFLTNPVTLPSLLPL